MLERQTADKRSGVLQRRAIMRRAIALSMAALQRGQGGPFGAICSGLVYSPCGGSATIFEKSTTLRSGCTGLSSRDDLC